MKIFPFALLRNSSVRLSTVILLTAAFLVMGVVPAEAQISNWTDFHFVGGTERANAIVVAPDGNVFVAGTASNGNRGSDAFVSKFTSTGTHLYTKYIGSNGNDQGLGIAVNAAGEAFVVGSAANTCNFDLVTPCSTDAENGFVAHLKADGTHDWTNIIGGDAADRLDSIALLSTGNMVVAGITQSSLGYPGSGNGFVVELDATTRDVVANSGLYVGEFDTTTLTRAIRVTVNSNNDVFLAGTSPDPFFQGIVVKLSNHNTHVDYSTLLGDFYFFVTSVTADANGNAYVTGEDFLTGGGDAFVWKLDSFSNVVGSRYLGGSAEDMGRDIALDGNGNLVVTGTTASPNLPVLNAARPTPYDGNDSFIAKLDSDLNLVYLTYAGTQNVDATNGIVDATNAIAVSPTLVYAAGFTAGADGDDVLVVQLGEGGETPPSITNNGFTIDSCVLAAAPCLVDQPNVLIATARIALTSALRAGDSLKLEGVVPVDVTNFLSFSSAVPDPQSGPNNYKIDIQYVGGVGPNLTSAPQVIAVLTDRSGTSSRAPSGPITLYLKGPTVLKVDSMKVNNCTVDTDLTAPCGVPDPLPATPLALTYATITLTGELGEHDTLSLTGGDPFVKFSGVRIDPNEHQLFTYFIDILALNTIPANTTAILHLGVKLNGVGVDLSTLSQSPSPLALHGPPIPTVTTLSVDSCTVSACTVAGPSATPIATATVSLSSGLPTGYAISIDGGNANVSFGTPQRVGTTNNYTVAIFPATAIEPGRSLTLHLQGWVHNTPPGDETPSGNIVDVKLQGPKPTVTLSLNPASLKGGFSTTATLSIDTTFETATSFTIKNTNSSTAVTFPASVTLPAGDHSTTFTINTSLVSATKTAIFTAESLFSTGSSISDPATLTINPFQVTLELNPTSVVATQQSAGKITIDSAAPASGLTFSLSSSNNAAATVPATVNIAGGATTGTFTVNTADVAAATPVTITSTLAAAPDNITTTAQLTVNPLVVTLSLNPASLKGGFASTATITLNAPVAVATNATITNTNSVPGISFPASVPLAAGASSATFTISTSVVSTVKTADFTATVRTATSAPATLTINPYIVTVSLNPSTVFAGQPSTGTVTLDSVTPTGGATVTLLSSNSAATAPLSVAIPGGSATANFTIQTSTLVVLQTDATITATLGTSGEAALTINPAPLLPTITLSAPMITYGVNGLVTVSVSSSGGPATGNVSLTVDLGAPITQALVGGSTIFTIPQPNAGDHALVALFIAQGLTVPTTALGTLHVDKATSTTTLSCSAGPFVYDGTAQQPCTATVTGAGGLNQPVTVSYTNNTNAGTATATASFTGDANHFGSSSDSATFTIAKAGSTTTLTCPASVTYDGTAQTPCTATVTGAGGLNQPVSINYLNNTNVGTANAKAAFLGDANHSGSPAAATFIINKASSTTAISCAAATYDGTAQTPCLATVTGVNGLNQVLTVSYTNNINAGATASAAASFAGDANHDGSNATKTFTINKASSATLVTCSAGPFVYDATAKTPCSATVTGAGTPSQTVTFTYTNNTNAGTATATASFAGDANHDGSSGSKTFAIAKASSTATVTCPASVPYNGAAQTPCTAIVTGAGTPSQAVTFTYANNVNVGTATATASFAGDANHDGSSGSKTFAIAKASSTTMVTCPASVPYNGAAQTPCSAVVTGAGTPSQTVTFTYANNVNVGTATATASFAGDANHDGSSGSKTFAIAKVSSTTTVTCPASVPYNGAAQTPCSAVATGVGGLSQAVTVTYTNNTNAGTATASASYAGDLNHNGSSDTKTFTITPPVGPAGDVAVIRHAPTLNSGLVQGSIQVLTPENITLNSINVAGNLMVPGSPTVKLNGHPTYGGTIDGTGASTPSNYTITLNGSASLQHVIRRTNAVTMPTVSAPTAPAGTRNVALNSPNDSPGNFATIRNLTLNGNFGSLAVPAGSYGNLTANGNSSFILGVAGSSTPAVYNLQDLTINGSGNLQIVGPVILVLANSVALNGSVGTSAHPEWLTLKIYNGGLTLNGSVSFSGYVLAPNGTVILNGNTTFTGGITADKLTLNGNSLLNLLP